MSLKSRNSILERENELLWSVLFDLNSAIEAGKIVIVGESGYGVLQRLKNLLGMR
jgi:hypothetical protein